MKWSHDITVSDRYSAMTLQLPNKIPLHWWQAKSVSRLIKGKFGVTKLKQEGQFMFLNQLCAHNCMGKLCRLNQNFAKMLLVVNPTRQGEGLRESIFSAIRNGNYSKEPNPEDETMLMAASPLLGGSTSR